MKRILHSSSVFTFLITAFLCGPGYLLAANGPVTPSNNQKSYSGFIENKGQIVDGKNKPNPAVLYLLNTPGFNVQLRRGGFSYDIYQRTSPPAPLLKERGEHFTDSSLLLQEKGLRDEVPLTVTHLFHRIDITLVGANPDCQLIPSGILPDYFNYFNTYAPPEGIRNVRQYSRITYKNIYPDIDLEFFTNDQNGYEYNFVINPGGNFNDIKMEIKGPENISLFRDTLKFGTRFGDLEELIPESFYLVNDVSIDIKSTFKRLSSEVYGFCITQPIPENSTLVIDPTSKRLWGTFYGGANLEQMAYCSPDKTGNIFLAGWTSSNNNIATTGSYQENLAGAADGYVAKFNSAGQRQWGTYFGGTGQEVVNSCFADRTGNIYISGYTNSQTGIASAGAHQTVFGGGFEDCFIEKFNSAGNRLWGTYYGGSSLDNWGIVTTDKYGNVFLTGTTSSDTGISTPGSYQPNLFTSDAENAFLAKFDSMGVRQWGTYYGRNLGEITYGCSSDSSGNVYFSGATSDTAGIASPGAVQTHYGGGFQDGFVAKFSTSGQRIWASYYGGLNADQINGCVTDSAENLILVGTTNSSNGIATAGSQQPVEGGGLDGFIVKFDSSGQRLWGTYFGGTNEDGARASTIGWNDEIFVTGNTASPNNISTPNSYQPVFAGGPNDCFLAKFNAVGQLQWGTYYGGTGGALNDAGYDCSYIKEDTIYMAGGTNSTGNIASPGSHQEMNGGGGDDMLIKFLDCWPIDTAGPITGPVNVCKPSSGLIYSIPHLPHAVNYTWVLPPGVIITSGAGTPNIMVNASAAASSGWIIVKGFNKCDDPGDSDSLFININPLPLPVISGPNNTCAGTGKVYTTAAGKTNYQWSVSAGGVITAGGTDTDNTVTVTWNFPGTEHVYLNYTDVGCSAATPTDYFVQVTPSPAVSITITPTLNSVCQGTLVTFNSTSFNEGGNPVYQWQVNGINSGINFSSFSYVPLNNDVVRCILTSSVTGCIMNNPDTSNEVIMIVNPNMPVGITLTALPNPPVCAGTTVTFTAHPVNEGNTPTYQWKVNGINAGTNLSTYSYIPVDGDLVTCTLTSSETCTTNNPATSTQYPVAVSPILPVSVSVTPTSNPFCAGSSVTFTANPTFGGTTPSYQWKVNGVNAGTNSNTFTYNPVNNDQVLCILTSSELCTSNNPASSIIITMLENNNLPAGVSIGASSNPFCPGTSVTFTASPSNGGAPVYQWKVNGVNIGINSNTYTYNPLNGDSIRCIMTSNLACVTNNPASSNKIIMSGTLAPIVTFTSCFDTITTINAKPVKLKGGVPLGGTYSGPGVNSLTGTFSPSTAGTGIKTISYAYTNAALCSASKSKNIVVQNQAAFTCGNNLIDIRDNKIYPTIQIGTQCWTSSNLNFGNTIASTQDQRDNCINEKYCYNDNPVNCTSYGGLYQWDEVMRFDDTPADQGFCPPGWHIPTENDWNTLFATFINNGFAGSPLKYSGYSGFNALLSGARHINRGWDFQGFATFFWSSTARSSDKAWAHGLNDPDPSVSFYPSSRANAFSVRCLKD